MNTPNHPKVKPLTREIALALGLEPRFIDFVFATERRECFSYWCEDVESGWTCYIPEDVDVAYPLWCTNADQTLVLVTAGRLSFAEGYHDDEDIEMISRTSQGLLAYLIDQMQLDGDELEAAAQFCGFRFLPEYREYNDTPLPDGVDWEQARSDFIARIDEKSM